MAIRRFKPLGAASGGGSQTPWTSNIDGGGYRLSDVSISLGDTNAVVIESTDSDGWLAFRPVQAGFGAYFYTTGDVGVYAGQATSNPPVSTDSGFCTFSMWDETFGNFAYFGYGTFANFDVISRVRSAK